MADIVLRLRDTAKCAGYAVDREIAQKAIAEIERLRAALQLVFDELGYAMPLDIFNCARAALEGK